MATLAFTDNIDGVIPFNDVPQDAFQNFSVPANTGQTVLNLYTVPANVYAVLRHVVVFAPVTPVSQQVYVYIRTIRNGTSSIVAWQYSATGNTTPYSESDVIPLQPGDKVDMVYANSNGTTAFIILASAHIDTVKQ